MIFSSLDFLLFFPVVYGTYWLLPKERRLGFLLVASLFFYATWSVKCLALLMVTVFVDYHLARAIAATEDQRRRRLLLSVSLVTNLGVLAVFKYADFFLVSSADVAGLLGAGWRPPVLDIILPIGISFYTFESLSYTIDVYYRLIEPTRRLRDYALFVSYFPHLIAGPILRARDFLPQLAEPPPFSRKDLADGLNLFLLGLMKKVFVADRLSMYVDTYFRDPRAYDGVTAWAAIVAYAFQIYCDFSGYSDMARGLGRTFGLEIMINFRTPYLSRSISEFWTRWHISLSTWLRDYLFTPLGGYRRRRYRNLFITMFLGGLWHGAAWTFVAWGAFHGLLLVAHRLLENLRLPDLPDAAKRLAVFALVCVGWVFFRAQSLPEAWHILGKMLTLEGGQRMLSRYSLLLVGVMLAYDLVAYELERRKVDLPAELRRVPPFAAAAAYAAAIVLLLVFAPHAVSPFIYFQF